MPSNPMLNDMRKTHDLAGRGYHAVYREHEANHCPGCGRTHWYIGRLMAECAFCETALPLESSSQVLGGQTVRTVRRQPYQPEEHVLAA